MPIFEYVCEDCRQPFEKIVRGDESVQCPHCNSGHIAKQFSTFGMSAGSSGKYESLPQYRAGGGGCCNPGACGCKN